MKSSEIALMAAVSALAALLAAAGLPGVGIPFMLALFCLPLAGFFALEAMGKAGLASPAGELLFGAACIVSYFFAAFSFSAIGSLASFAFVPLLLCVPAAVRMGRRFVSG